MSGPPPGLMRKKAMGDGDKASTIKAAGQAISAAQSLASGVAETSSSPASGK
eukprot:CAMPEP_0179429008 /NCGR_PEP_ID=MMETSP0799-20121207/14513_1 /TAXON_ID=46947 /ORGANISM="Geminigera cryophila, Strain CCMP2564" /LENGTH=51 /DNA_ID=CAMNT_0021204739 /DNA_START=101 /DNA_END=256 /DNA_ORIENTATION=+